MRRALLLTLSILLIASAAMADVPVLTTDGVLYSADRAERTSLTVTRRSGMVRSLINVPTTAGPAIESDATLTYDATTNVLFVLWRSSSSSGDEIRIATLDASGKWSDPVTVTSSDSMLRLGGLKADNTSGVDHLGAVTLVHAVWWRQSSQVATPQYALVAFDRTSHVSTDVASLNDLAAVRVAINETPENTGAAIFPPLAIEAVGEDVDVVYGDTFTTRLTRVRVIPRAPAGNARIWKPVGKDGKRMPSSRIASSTTEPVQAFISGSKVVLYTPDQTFRYVVFENSQWSPMRQIALDQTVTAEQVVAELRKTVEASSSATPQPGN